MTDDERRILEKFRHEGQAGLTDMARAVAVLARAALDADDEDKRFADVMRKLAELP